MILSKKRIELVNELSKETVETYVNIEVLARQSTAAGSETNEVCKDKMYLYAREILSFCLLWHGFHDEVSEGDEDRVLQYWKFYS